MWVPVPTVRLLSIGFVLFVIYLVFNFLRCSGSLLPSLIEDQLRDFALQKQSLTGQGARRLFIPVAESDCIVS